MGDSKSIGTGQKASFFSSIVRQIHTLFVPKRVGYTVAGAFAFAGAATTLNISAPPKNPATTPFYVVQKANAASTQPKQPGADNSATTKLAFSAATSNSSSAQQDVQLHVNGQNIPVPANGTTRQTVTNSDGSQTSVNATSSTDSQGNTSNSLSTSFNLNISSNSKSSGGTDSP